MLSKTENFLCLISFNLHTVPRNIFYYPHFIDEEMKSQRNDSLKVIHLVNSTVRI